MKNIIIVDDDKDINELIQAFLEKVYKGICCHIVSKNAEVIRLCKTINPDLIISDLNRPYGSGYELVKAIHNDNELKYIPIIIISANFKMNQELELYREWVFAVLKKPFTLKSIVENVDRIFKLNSDPDIALLTMGKESPTLDYKEIIEFKNKTNVAAFAKDIIAMANTNGGTIIIGEKEIEPGQFELVGIPTEMLKDYEVTQINKIINQFVDPSFHIESKIIKNNGKQFCRLNIPVARETPILAKKQNDEAKLFLGRIYIRNNSAETCEIRTSNEIRTFLNKYKTQENA
jgi:two-component system, chemotaxis family, chemotaxis protein CheY